MHLTQDNFVSFRRTTAQRKFYPFVNVSTNDNTACSLPHLCAMLCCYLWKKIV